MSAKLTTEELAEVSQLEQDYAQIKLALGDIVTKIAELDNKLAELDSEKFDHLETYKIIVQRDKDLNTKISEKYGRGVIDLRTGEITAV